MVVLPSTIGPLHFGLPSGLIYLLGFIPLLILFLIRPRPKRMELPSLMFFMRGGGKSLVRSFFHTFMRDILIVLQLLIALCLLLAPTLPFFNTNINLAEQHTVFVIDTSASMQVMDGGQTRLSRAIDTATSMLAKKNTIVLAKGTPTLLTQGISASEARKVLASIKPTDTTSRIGEAMLLAGQALDGDGSVIVISDFDNTDGVEPQTAKQALESRGKQVAFINLADKQPANIGVIDLAVGEDSTTMQIKNYNKKEATVSLHINKEIRQLTLGPDGVEPVKFTTPPGTTTITLDTKDAYPADDTAYISAPGNAMIKVLLVTNRKSRFIESALTSSPRIQLKVSEPPIVDKGDYDVYIVDQVTHSEVLPGTYQELLNKARQGRGVIINAQDGMGAVNYAGLLPVRITGDGKDSYVLVDDNTKLTHNLEFGSVKTHIITSLLPGAISVASTTDNSSLIAIKHEGAGVVVFYGISETASDFKLTPDYPIFWQNLLRLGAQRDEMSDLNKRTGTSITLAPGETIKAPDGSVHDGPIYTFEKKGFYTNGDSTIAVSNLEPRESALLPHPTITSESAATVGTSREQRQWPWEPVLLCLAALLLFVELVFIKIRGDV